MAEASQRRRRYMTAIEQPSVITNSWPDRLMIGLEADTAPIIGALL
jgi:hypothetical protein